MKRIKLRPPFPERLTALYLGLMALVYPLWVTGDYQTISAQKFRCFLFLTGGYVLAMAVLGIEMSLLGQARCPKPRQVWKGASAPQRLIVLFWLLSALSTLLSPWRSEALWGMSRNEGFVTLSLLRVFPAGVRIWPGQDVDALSVGRVHEHPLRCRADSAHRGQSLRALSRRLQLF
ncbi:hypothetical protein KQI82_01800 [Oscillibacter sp. MSJ-2]|uniref:Uncharacterized protein n=1 Tax=Dysosmobacter acutus TaxID=2841504 RepID=A0ABS6F5U5_9FIRM|nr:hypothetical protein [Dysosmobacter acutus]MBU5625668.1 hypothetical protein [Dysosmobacter acutus]